jgi:hypothetical protein
MDKSTRALAKRLAPRTGTVACQVPPEQTLALHDGPCYARCFGVASARRHLDAVDRAAEPQSTKPRGRAGKVGHMYVSEAQAALRAQERMAVGTVRAMAAVAAEEEDTEE